MVPDDNSNIRRTKGHLTEPTQVDQRNPDSRATLEIEQDQNLLISTILKG